VGSGVRWGAHRRGTGHTPVSSRLPWVEPKPHGWSRPAGLLCMHFDCLPTETPKSASGHVLIACSSPFAGAALCFWPLNASCAGMAMPALHIGHTLHVPRTQPRATPLCLRQGQACHSSLHSRAATRRQQLLSSGAALFLHLQLACALSRHQHSVAEGRQPLPPPEPRWHTTRLQCCPGPCPLLAALSGTPQSRTAAARTPHLCACSCRAGWSATA
jgi:hypothetical protein